MKITLILCMVTVSVNTMVAQNQLKTNVPHRQGSWYVFWGWNWDDYSKSDITFSGTDYHFTLQEVVARDSPSDFTLEKYFGIRHFSIPQFNFRIGYCLSSHWDLSLGMDHMKYVVEQNQVAKIDGTISHNESPYNGEYTDDNITLTEDFLQFEHTDGLNYENIEARYSGRFFDLNKITFNYTVGAGVGMLLPKTNTVLLNMPRHDDYHLSGYGIAAVGGINVLFFEHFFIQAELKTGIINMPDIRTTFDSSDRAHQQFMFFQRNIVFGALIHFGHKATPESKNE
jgi:hypothetical protein